MSRCVSVLLARCRLRWLSRRRRTPKTRSAGTAPTSAPTLGMAGPTSAAASRCSTRAATRYTALPATASMPTACSAASRWASTAAWATSSSAWKQTCRQPTSRALDDSGPGFTYTASASVDWFATARVRGGYATNAMLDLRHRRRRLRRRGLRCDLQDRQHLRPSERRRYPVGFVLGAGVEFALQIELVAEVRVPVPQLRRSERDGRLFLGHDVR